MLFKTIEELQVVVNVNGSLSVDKLKPHIDRVEIRYIADVISGIEYRNLVAAYMADGILPDKSTNLLTAIRPAIASLAMWQYYHVGKLQNNDTGVTVNAKKDASRAADEKEMNTARDFYRETGFTELENIYRFLELNKDIYTDWAASSSYTIFKECFINTSQDFGQWVNINESRRTFLALKSIMKRIELFKIKPLILGLFDEIKGQILAGTITDANKALLTLICPAVAHCTIEAACDENIVSIMPEGFYDIDFSNRDVAPARKAMADTIEDKEEYHCDIAKNYLQLALDLILNNLADYPAYTASPAYVPPAGEPIDPNTDCSKIILF